MNVAELLVGCIAPHVCLVCEREGAPLCGSCRLIVLPTLPSRCYRCHKATRQYSVCVSCRRSVQLLHVWVAAGYEDVPKELIYRLKFQRVQAVADVLAWAINETLPLLPQDVTVAHIPTVNSRIRQRGYDQAQLVACKLAKIRGLQYRNILKRSGSSRQVGAGRKNRFKQLENAFSPMGKLPLEGAHVLLIDDVLTTGATLEAASKALSAAGVKTVDGAVFAQA